MARGGYGYGAAPAGPSLGVRAVTIGIIVVLLIAIGFQLAGRAGGSPDAGAGAGPGALDASDQPQPAPEPTQVTVTFAGDCTLGTDEAFDYATSLNALYEAVDGPEYFLKNVQPIFSADDLTIVNMEGTLTTSSARADKTFAFKGPAEFAKILSSSSVEAASLANNHSRDYGEQSYQDTIAALDAEGVPSFGYERIGYVDVKGVKVGLVGAYELAEHEGMRDDMVARIQEARDNGAQLVLVYIHWGIERETVPNDTQMMLGRAAIDAGADLVVGSHPHVIQGWEVYEGRYIVYSLGNFCFGGNSNPADKDCMIFQQTFTVTGDEVAKDDDVEFIACSVSSSSSRNNYQPTPAEGDEKARIDAKIQRSTDAIAEKAAARG
ncbi:CapA family protein [Adlercreutzia faecimuris]|uniref:CapA family protein n=1 Tax=Adlercreutzia faecimuris TaxID=2897341 RepID=A0ABS9WHQ2_9ACTN|nr:CapA family protein [Adlercreutzia sp. JBNU-10]MCI2242403.1 CapA family protein [Adlercreutzia sp. JBNU-10]